MTGGRDRGRSHIGPHYVNKRGDRRLLVRISYETALAIAVRDEDAIAKFCDQIAAACEEAHEAMP